MNNFLKELMFEADESEQTTQPKPRSTKHTFLETKVKGILSKVTVQLSGSDSGSMTKLAKRYIKLVDAIKVMGQHRDALNDKLKLNMEDIFGSEDAIATRIVETAQFTIQLSKRAPAPADKKNVDYEAIVADLEKLVDEELLEKIKELKNKYTTITKGVAKSPALSVKGGESVNESVNQLFKDIYRTLSSMFRNLKSWGKSYDKKLADLVKRSQEI